MKMKMKMDGSEKEPILQMRKVLRASNDRMYRAIQNGLNYSNLSDTITEIDGNIQGVFRLLLDLDCRLRRIEESMKETTHDRGES
jgi:hypothetical protein